MTHRTLQTSGSPNRPRVAALVLLLTASISGGFLIHADVAEPTFGRTALGDNFQIEAKDISSNGMRSSFGMPLGGALQLDATRTTLENSGTRTSWGTPLGSQIQVGAATDRLDTDGTRTSFGVPLGAQLQVDAEAGHAPASGIIIDWRVD